MAKAASITAPKYQAIQWRAQARLRHISRQTLKLESTIHPHPPAAMRDSSVVR
ncbi:unnamed protein product [Ectocarpus fasciculatus]